MSPISRRTVLTGSAAIGVLAAAGWRGGAALSDEALVRSVLERHLGPITMDEGDLVRFAAAFDESSGYLLPGEKLKAASNVSFDLGMHGHFRRMLPEEDEDEFSRYERALLAAFHVMTDFPMRKNSAAPVHFVDAAGCRNPFAQFE